MKSYILLAFFTLSFVFAKAQINSTIMEIEYNSTSRAGDVKEIIISKDSLKINSFNRRQPADGEYIIRHQKAKEWEKLLKTIKDINIEGISELPSPTNKRSFDGALHSEIIIKYMDGRSYSHLFDDENPHEKLLALMKCILAIKKG